MIILGKDDRKEALWRPCAKTEIGEEMCLSTKNNYKVHADIHLSPSRSTRFLPVLGTGAGTNVIHEKVLTPKMLKHVKRQSMPIMRYANKRRLMMTGSLRLRVQLAPFALEVKLIVCVKFAVSLILGGDFSDRFVEAIYLQRKHVVFYDTSTIRISRKKPEGAPRDE